MEINKERFEAYLYSQPKDELVDISDGTNCLLCRFLFHEIGQRFRASFDIFVLETHAPNPGSYRLIPNWFRDIINPNSAQGKWLRTMGELQDDFRSVFPKESEQKSENSDQAIKDTAPPVQTTGGERCVIRHQWTLDELLASVYGDAINCIPSARI